MENLGLYCCYEAEGVKVREVIFRKSPGAETAGSATKAFRWGVGESWEVPRDACRCP